MTNSEKRYLIILGLAALIFFFIYSAFYWSLRPAAVGNDFWIFNTPDETANYFFIKNFIVDGEIQEFERLNIFSGKLNLVHPRSITVVDNYLVPGGFLGFIWLARTFGILFGLGVVPFITPLVSLAALGCFYYFIKRIFTAKIAFFSSLALLVLPAFWYYNSRSLFNNLIFLDFLIIGLCLLTVFWEKKQPVFLAFGSLFFGLALTIRPVDVFWALGLVLIGFFCYRRKVSFGWIFLFGLIILLCFIPVLGYQYHFYGHPLASGYNPGLVGSDSGSVGLFKVFINRFLFPFGINFYHIGLSLYHYFAKMFWWYFWPALGGGLLLIFGWLKGRLDAPKKFFLAGTVLVYVWILFYYGSWWFFNNLMAKPLIGSSQTRYFLPLYLLAVPLMVYFWNELVSRLPGRRLKQLVVLILAVGIAGGSAWAVLRQDEESLLNVRETVLGYHQINRQVRRLTDENSVIITSYGDKIFFPSRKVIVNWRSSRFLAGIEGLIRETDVYFYAISPEEVNYLTDYSNFSTSWLADFGNQKALYQVIK